MPLTKEILLSNGFHESDNHFSLFAGITEDEWYTIQIEFAHENVGAIRSIKAEHVYPAEVKSVKLSTIGGREYFVHELQHALKNCEINKDIEL